MKQFSYTDSVTSSFSQLGQHKILFLILMLFQILLIVVLSMVQFSYQVKVLEKSNELVTYLNQVEQSQPEQDLSNLLGDDPLLLQRNAEEIAGLLRTGIILTMVIFVFGNGLLWAFTDAVFRKTTPKKFFSVIIKYISISMAYLIPFLIIIFFVLKAVLFGAEEPSLAKLASIIGSIFMVILYFMLISVAFAISAKQWPGSKQILKKTWRIGIRSWYPLMALLINAFFITLFGALFYWSIEAPMWMLFLAGVLFTFTLVFSRLLWLHVITGLNTFVILE